MRFLVTGGNGYIGSHMCQLLKKHNHEVVIFDDHSTSPEVNTHDYGQFVRVDVGDGPKALKHLKELDPFDGVFHFADRAQVAESELDPLLYYRENVIKTLSFFDALKEVGQKNIVYSSSCSVYGGDPGSGGFQESSPQEPKNTYGRTKKMVEEALRDLSFKEIFNVAVLRYFNVAGSCPEGLIGENHDPETRLIPLICQAALSEGEKTFELFGREQPTSDGSCIRDYVHVVDLVEAHLSAFERLLKVGGFLDYNLGSARGYSVLEVFKTAKEILGRDIPLVERPPRPGDPPCLVANSQKARSELSWNPGYDLKAMIQHCFKYQRSKV